MKHSKSLKKHSRKLKKHSRKLKKYSKSLKKYSRKSNKFGYVAGNADKYALATYNCASCGIKKY